MPAGTAGSHHKKVQLMNVKDMRFLGAVFDGPVLNLSLMNGHTRLTGVGIKHDRRVAFLGNKEKSRALEIVGMQDFLGKVKLSFANRPH